MAGAELAGSGQLAAWAGELAAGLEVQGMALDMAGQQRLLAYLGLLAKWNARYNLTAVRDPRDMVSRQLLDSLAVRPWLRGARILDLGTGAGLPGIPLAIAEPGRHFVLVDSNGKKTRFVQQAVHELALGNVEVRRQRVEELECGRGFDSVTARAFASLADLVRLATPCLAPGGCILALKSRLAGEEAAGLGPGYRVAMHPLLVPGSDRERRLLLVEPAGSAA